MNRAQRRYHSRAWSVLAVFFALALGYALLRRVDYGVETYAPLGDAALVEGARP